LLPCSGQAGVQLAILGLAYLYRRVVLPPTESAWRGSLVRHWWAVASMLIAAFYLFAGISQLVGEGHRGPPRAQGL
jgi:hypothetical protein